MIAFMGNLCPIASEKNMGLIPLFELLLVLIVQLVLIVGVVGAGLSISPSVLHDLINKRETFLFLTFLQTLFIPLMGVATVVILQPTIDVQRAILIIAACPAGGISSLYVLFARSNAAFSVAMTLTSIGLVSVTMPLILFVFKWLGYESISGHISLFSLSFRLFVIMAVSAAIGFGIRAYRPALATQWESRLRRMSVILILIVVLAVFWDEWDSIKINFFQMFLSASMFFSLILITGIIIGYLLFGSAKDRYAVAVEFGARNLSVGIFVAIGLFGHTEFAGSAAVYLLIEATVLLLLGNAVRRRL